MTDPHEIQIIPVDAITVINPRERNPRVFNELVTSIAHLGLKKPITVSRRQDQEGYDLVCGQGRLEAFIALGEREIPAIVIEASQEDCYMMSLVENLARRNPRSLELMREIGSLKNRGYNNAEIAGKIDFSPDYVGAICFLLEHGENRLLVAVERGLMPPNIAIEIARAPEAEVQQALADAYEAKALPGKQILAIRRIIQQRNQMGKGGSGSSGRAGSGAKVTAASLVQSYQKEAERQKLLVKKADLTQSRLLFIVNALRRLFGDDDFVVCCEPKTCTHCRGPWRHSWNSWRPEMPEQVKIAFQRRVIVLPLAEIMPMRSVSATIRQMLKYKRILASIGEVGIVEPLVLAPRNDETEPYMLVDGHLRLAALAELGATTAPCLVAHDDEGFTYNKRVNRLATVQEHYMITKALERGVSEQRLARTLNIDVRQIRLKRSLLVGICPEVIDLLKDRSIDRAVFTALRKMKAMRQIDAVELMMAMNNFTSRYAQALLAATRQEDLARPEQPKTVRGLTPEQMARMEREMEGLQREFKAVEASYGDSVLNLVVASGYLTKMIGNKQLSGYLERHYPEILVEFQAIVAASSLDDAGPIPVAVQ